ncbi:MAG: hypothetical protein K9N10_05935, partial [Deltaproteobacteria bacterium]|nr:hypothetical protein [Deltaproteobacteria bacterium]
MEEMIRRIGKPRKQVRAVRRGFDLTILSMILFAGCYQAQTPEDRASAKSSQMDLVTIVQQKRHHGQDRFINPFAPAAKKGFSDFLKWKLFSENHFK